ncbi:MAG: hypothetical protein F4Y67_02980 [Chloroflexi bacterium]|nr:cache domain-containing protein [Chloroflexota bacterium]MXX99771.1 hypothetical protein [Chloroflexota bacterium]MXY12705.1 hypothetical protein [Chloroflexota bacterium]MYB16183.1 hypothetical protein [Chloroflexota bacterium]
MAIAGIEWLKRLLWIACAASLAAVSLAACEPGGPAAEPELDSAEAVQAAAAVTLAEAAIAAYEADPEGTFEELSTPGGPWQIGEMYVFVIDRNSVIQAHAADPGLVGLDLSETVDSDGYLFTPGLVEQASEDGGWDIYRFTNPVTGEAEPKRSYVRLLDDGLILGVGYYLDETRFVKHIVNDALAVWETESDPIQIYQTDPRFNRGEAYLFVVRARDLVSLATQAEPQLVGTSLADLTDHTGKKFALEGRALADADGEWLYYGYLNPDTGAEEQKQSWLVRVDEVIIGAGFYRPL